MNKRIDVGVNAPRDLGSFNTNISTEQIKALKKISHNHLSLSDLRNKDLYDVLVIDNALSKETSCDEDDEDILIYDIANRNGVFCVSTGNYIGRLFVDGVSLNINSGYGDFFLKRLLDFSNDIFVSNDKSFAGDKNEDAFKWLVQYLFLSSLSRASINGLPKKYKTVNETGFCVRGTIDIVHYVKGGMVATKGLPYSYKERNYDQDILDVIYRAISICKAGPLRTNPTFLSPISREVLQNKSSKTVAALTIAKAKRSPLLSNPMYLGFRRVINYAEMVIAYESSSPKGQGQNSGVSGWLLNIADLWELYIYRILKRGFADWEVCFQESIPVYSSLFFGTVHGGKRTFYPDIVMKKGNDVVVLDAKFKKMDFNVRGNDIDRNDIHQIHSYYAYYHSMGKRVRCISLVFPTRCDDAEDKKAVAPIYDGYSDTKFAVSFIVVGTSSSEQVKHEEEFVGRLKRIVE